MPARSAITLLGILQQHGLCVEVLELLAQLCEQGQTGCVTLHLGNGVFQVVEPHYRQSIATLRTSPLTKLS